ncbi:MAG: efflux RND transporter permease subunit [Pseudomonadales bacterium]|nr:efflux RND transporter permease subunit [Pseudomonadales bacterium]
MNETKPAWLDLIVARTLNGGIPMFLFLTGLIAGFLALQFTPREEEPQIVVPMVTVSVSAPGLNAEQVERQVTTPLEKLLAQIKGVEHVYSITRNAGASVTLRFFVGQDREDSIFNTYNKLYANQDKIPAVVAQWLIQPIEVDDIPVLMLGFWSDANSGYSDYELRRVADEVSTYIQGIPQTNEVRVTGGRQRQIRIILDPEALSARSTTTTDIVYALQISNKLTRAGDLVFNDQVILIESGDFYRSVDEVGNAIINVVDGIPVHLKDVAQVLDDKEIPESYQWLELAGQHEKAALVPVDAPMVTISVAKQPGANAVTVVQEVHNLIAELRSDVIPDGMHVETLRDYGVTADEKVNNLVVSLAFAVMTVVVFIGIFLGWRHAIVVGLAVPICYGITLALDMAFGYSINRVTLFALILSLGLLVDDPITGVDNIERYLRQDSRNIRERIIAAMSEIRPALLISTVTIILAFVPLAFITGMMGPYMAPMAFNVPVSVSTSTLVAFMVTPWLASKLLKPSAEQSDAVPLLAPYERLLGPVIDNRSNARKLLWGVLAIFLLTCMLPAFRMVPLKLLPFDNKSEVQILVDMPEGTSLEATAGEARRIAALLKRIPEVRTIGVYAGEPSPIDFNGMVRRYYQRVAPHLADLRVLLVDKTERVHQSHAIVLRMRELLRGMDSPANIKVIEVPPGPPVLDTLVAEIYGERTTSYGELQTAAAIVKDRLQQEPHVVQVDTSVEDDQLLRRFVVDKEKAALSGISTADINQTLAIANAGTTIGYLNLPREATPLPVNLRLAQQQRASENDLAQMQVRGRSDLMKLQQESGLEAAPQSMVSIGELGSFESHTVDKSIFHKDLRPVVFVTADLSGRTPAEIIADVHADYGSEDAGEVTDWDDRNYLAPGGGIAWSLPNGTDMTWGGEGEWRITIRVFRDMGLAFLFALLAIFFVLNFQTGSVSLSLIIMSSIPLTVIGIMPGFWLLNQFGEREIAGAPEPVLFTATAMIGMIALAGIVVRNSLILVEFIEQARREGYTVRDAVVRAGAVRMRPVLLTAGTTLLGNLVITLDPVFSGLALAIIFGITSSTIFTLVVVPIVYFLVFDDQQEQTVTS